VLASSGENLEYDDSNKKLTIFFEYRGLSKDEEKEYGTRNVQEAILAKVKDEITSQVEDSGLKASLTKVVSVSKDKKTERTLIEKHLRTYTKKNTTDYFIHKNLKDFLVGELDFYIKNEVFHLDDLGTENELSVEQYVTRAKVMKKICLKIIDFLAQIENFQKMLFEKKKFVVKTDYCMTLDNVPEELYSEIVKNEDQLNEWNILYGIGENKQGTLAAFNGGINEAYLKENPYLVIDTKFFEQEFKDSILSSFDDIDDTVGGLMMNSENWQALNVMQEKYHEKVKCVYIDPPYNTGIDGFNYKDNYQHSSWLTLMNESFALSSSLLSEKGTVSISIDDVEISTLRNLLSNVFGPENFIQHVIWKKRGGAPNDKIIGSIHEYILLYAKNIELLELFSKPRSKEQIKRYKNPDKHPKGPWAADNLMANVKGGRYVESLYFPIINPDTGDEHYPSSHGNWRFNHTKINQLLDNDEIYFGVDGQGRPKLKRFLCDVKEGVPYSTIWDGLPHNTAASKELEGFFGSINVFDTPKPYALLKEIFKLATKGKNTILDYFAGSGTTAHAVLNLNKEDNGNRKYILVEMGEYFDTVTKPRIQKVMYSDKWKDGKPQSTDGISHIFKYQTLEQYEDTLNNIEFTEAGTIQRTLADMDGYFLRYMLDFETGERSPCRFNVEKLTNPFDYTLKIAQGNELTEQTVDLVETFNYLLGLHVRQIRTFTNNSTYYRVVLGTKNEDDIAVIWRDTEDLNLKEDKNFIEETILNEFNPSKTYINSDFYVEGAHPIEPEFKKLMVG
ncbi:site-specific DNA-methyltransferase, partial [Candidatus Babeliales bacterium]|nr:site-specific DNA-methyltransferase [Candidatus Babeliales bacterium]